MDTNNTVAMPQNYSKQCATKSKAEQYAEINDIQQQYGKNLSFLAGLKEGDKVLDMGCGTGEITYFLAEKVGNEGEVLGVDPDLERIESAIQKCPDDHKNLTFKHGESSSQFLHFEDQYFDVHFSNFVFQWLNAEEKEIFVKTAFRCLKPGGRLAITCYEEEPQITQEAQRFLLHDLLNAKGKVQTAYLVSKSATEMQLQKAGFDILHSEYYELSYTFPSSDDFLTWLCASDYFMEEKISSRQRKEFMNKVSNVDGTATMFAPSIYQIVARKKDLF